VTTDVLELARAQGEGLRGDPAEAVRQVGEPLGAGEEITNHQQAPPVADAFQRAGDQAEVVVALTLGALTDYAPLTVA
jgi:hypothetical protein